MKTRYVGGIILIVHYKRIIKPRKHYFKPKPRAYILGKNLNTLIYFNSRRVFFFSRSDKTVKMAKNQ